MDKYIKQFIKSAKDIKLEKEEKSRMRSILESYIFNNPVRDEVVLRHNRHDWSKKSLNNLAFLNVFHLKMPAKPMPILLILTLMIGGGFSAAAENSLPKDVLYPVKIEVNEKVRGWFATSPEAEAQWQTTLIERRLQESEKLAAEGQLDADTQADLESDFEVHAQKAREGIDQIDNDNEVGTGADISSRLESSLKAHEQILLRLSDQNEDNNSIKIHPLLLKVRLNADKASKDRGDLENKLIIKTENQTNLKSEIDAKIQADIESAADNKLNAAQNKIDEVRRFIEQVKDSVKVEAIAEAQAELRLADKAIFDGKMKMETKAYGESFALFQKAQRIAQEAKLILKARNDLKIDEEVEIKKEIKINANINSNDSEQNTIRSHGNLKVNIGL